VTVLVGLVAGLLAGVIALGRAGAVSRAPALQRTNHRDRTLPTAMGVLAVVAVLAVEAVWTATEVVTDERWERGPRRLAVLVALGFGLLGLLDDLVGSGGDGRGFRGHLRAMRSGQLTTGFVKLAGGGAVAVIVASGVSDRVIDVVVDALLIALAANLANLLDRAPGRAGKVGAVAFVALLIAGGAQRALGGVAAVVGAVVALLPADLHERLMLGDAGANVLGAALGLGVALVAPTGVRVAVLVVLLALNLLSEAISFSSVIERVPPLRWLDQLGRSA
jgi:UDP-N-acetylmuramyl pentapeptide phosphotransferase/UDP-N-acetylglucosamine-1-phosphate transferase